MISLSYKDYGWYLVKDVVLANTGLYFVDMESAYYEEVESRIDLKKAHKLYFNLLFKDLSRLLTLYDSAVEGINLTESRRVEEIETKFGICKVDKTTWPVRAAWVAKAAVSSSRISPTIMMSGSCLTTWRRPLAKV